MDRDLGDAKDIDGEMIPNEPTLSLVLECQVAALLRRSSTRQFTTTCTFSRSCIVSPPEVHPLIVCSSTSMDQGQKHAFNLQALLGASITLLGLVLNRV
jgi:hypothetical protein